MLVPHALFPWLPPTSPSLLLPILNLRNSKNFTCILLQHKPLTPSPPSTEFQLHHTNHSTPCCSWCLKCFQALFIIQLCYQSRELVAKMMKHAAADAKEKLGNMTAKVEEKMDKGKASAAEKADKAMAHDKAGKLEAKQLKHEREADAEHAKDVKQVENAREVGQAKENIAESKAAHPTHATPFSTAAPLTNDGLAQQGTGGGMGASAIQGPGI